MIYRFAGFELDTAAHEIRHHRRRVSVEERVFCVLAYLLEHRARLVSRNELVEQCWPGRIITDGTLTTCMSRVRRVVARDAAHTREVIHTVHGQGYRFVAEVDELAPELDVQSQVAEYPLDGVQHQPVIVSSSPAPAPVVTMPIKPPDLPAKPALSPVPEVRYLTVLDCELIDASRTSDRGDSEQLYLSLQAFRNASVGIISRAGGYLARFSGDRLLAYFGYPKAQEEAAPIAVRTGLQLAATSLGHGLSLRIGVHSGPTIVEPVPADDSISPIAVGPTPAVAAQLQRLAPPQSVLISRGTARLVAGYFKIFPLRLPTIVEQPEATPAYRVAKAHPRQTRLDAVAAVRGLTPFIGREPERMLLESCWARSCAGRGQTVLITGDPGIGKSRLLRNLREHVAAGSHLWLELHCVDHKQNAALQPIQDLLHRLVHWHAEDSTEKKLAKLERWLRCFRLPRSDVVPWLMNLMSSETEVIQTEQRKTLEILLRLLTQTTAKRTLLLLVEDIHWADPSTLELMELIAARAPAMPIMLACTARTDFAHPRWLQSSATSLVLGQLSPDESKEMLWHVTGARALPASFRQHVVEKTDGVPLFIEELTNSAVESGEQTATGSCCELSGEWESASIPATLRNSLMVRLDRLKAGKPLIQWGAMLGRRFSLGLLASVMRVAESELRQGINELVSSNLVIARGEGSQTSFEFKHVLIQEAAEKFLVNSQRRLAHRRIAEVLESLYPATLVTEPERIARHYTEADLPERAIPCWQKAGDLALARSAAIEAASHYTAGLKLIRSLPGTVESGQLERRIKGSLARCKSLSDESRELR